jgi:NAD(P)-dependent dehydrogenase (short-subunit alcohol dehydrogenase family)
MSDAMVRFDGRVALVTGAGGGMGRCYALELAARGASVVVNDYGGTIFGAAGDASRAEAVAEEIRAAGGRAVANGDAVGTIEAAERMVALAKEQFGRFDILINNAGIAQPGPITDHDFAKVERVYATNLIGPHALMRAAWPTMRGQGYGRILNISSDAALGIGGNTPYAASKAGLLGLSFDAALEGTPHNILVNALMPVGYSRMIENTPDPDFVAWMKANFQPEKVARAALFLLSEGSEATGMVFTAGGGRLARIGLVANAGLVSADISPEEVHDRIGRVLDLGNATPVASQSDEIALYTAVAPFGRESGPGLVRDALT